LVNTLVSINAVALHWARLLLGWGWLSADR